MKALSAIVACAIVLTVASGCGSRNTASKSGTTENSQVVTAMPPSNVNASNFRSEVENSEGVVLVDVYAPWCGACSYIAPHVDALPSETQGKVTVKKMNFDECRDIAQGKLGVEKLPTLLVYKNGRQAGRIDGAPEPQELVAWVKGYVK